MRYTVADDNSEEERSFGFTADSGGGKNTTMNGHSIAAPSWIPTFGTPKKSLGGGSVEFGITVSPHSASSSTKQPQVQQRQEGDQTQAGMDGIITFSGKAAELIPVAPPPSSFVVMPPRHRRDSVLQRLSEALLTRSLTKIDLSQRGLQASDARLVKMALLQNAHLTVLKLGYNNLENYGACLLADGIRQHESLESLDLGFNNIGDEGCCALATAIQASTPPLKTLYLAGNLIQQEGASCLANNLIRKKSCLQRLYLTGNRLGPDGVAAITEAIEEDEQRMNGSYDCMSPETDEEGEQGTQQQQQQTTFYVSDGRNATQSNNSPQHDTLQTYRNHAALHRSGSTSNIKGNAARPDLLAGKETERSSRLGLEELFLGGTSMGPEGCKAVARSLRVSTHLAVISLTNCDLNDEDLTGLCAALKASKGRLPIKSLQLSFNQITSKGVEQLVNAIWGSTTLRELLIDNNQIGDRGAQQLASVLPYVENMVQIDVGFNGIKSFGLKQFMNAVAESKNISTLSLSGNTLDPSSAKTMAYALAFNSSLVSLNIVNCSTESTILRQIAAGIVSNSQIALRDLLGFELGPLVVTLGFPDAVGHWTNEQVLNFLHTMWEKFGNGIANHTLEDDDGDEEAHQVGMVDPLHFLPGMDTPTGDFNRNGDGRPAPKKKQVPLAASTVVEVAKKAFDALVQEGFDVFSRRPGHPKADKVSSPLPRNASRFVMEDKGAYGATVNNDNNADEEENASSAEHMASSSVRSFVVAPEPSELNSSEPDPSRKKRVVEWLCKNIQDLNKLSQQPFSSAEMWRLHQHYYTPVVNESGGSVAGMTSSNKHNSQPEQQDEANMTISSVPDASRTSSSENRSEDAMSRDSGGDSFIAPVSDPFLKQSPTALGSFSMLKRKVSYRFLGDAALSSHAGIENRFASAPLHQEHATQAAASVFHQPISVAGTSTFGAATSAAMPRKNKRARRNRSRISFLPRIKTKLESQLDVCHEKALVIMRQLYYVEKAILRGEVNPINPSSTARTHLSADFAVDAEMIIMDMI